jgi:NAD(P)-dependent dehydrogenase (short-subunit alcohol dehydrogenase family)
MTKNTLDLFRLDGKVAVVTGSGQGIGRGIALALADAGADVVVTARRQGDVEETAKLVGERGRRAATLCGDIRGDTSERLAALAVDELGRLDIWVSNVGGNDEKDTRELMDTSDDHFREQLELNLTTAFQGAKAAAQRMSEGGAIINIASGAGMRASPRTGPYAAAKAGMLNFTETLAAELAPQRIRVNAVSPGPVPTEAFVAMLEEPERLQEYADAVPLGRFGTPQDIAAAVLYFASEASGWVTGQNILVAGGRTHRTVAYGQGRRDS